MTSDTPSPALPPAGGKGAADSQADAAPTSTILNALMSSRAIVEQMIREERNVETLGLHGVLAEIGAAIRAAQEEPSFPSERGLLGISDMTDKATAWDACMASQEKGYARGFTAGAEAMRKAAQARGHEVGFFSWEDLEALPLPPLSKGGE